MFNPRTNFTANNKYFLIKEAIKAFDSYPNKNLKQKVIDHWSSNKWVPCYTIRYWYILVEKFRQGKPLREWELVNGEFKNLAGRTPLVKHEDVCNFVSSRNNGEAFGKDDVTEMFSVVEKRRKQEHGLYCIPSKEVC